MRRIVLIVDDNAINRMMLHNILDAEYEVLEVESGEAALEELRKKYTFIAAVILDIMMPEMDGYEVLAKMKDNPSLSQIPVLVATGTRDTEAELKAISLGANDFVTKPYNPALILNCLRNAIKLRETASLMNAIQRDKLTGLYNRDAFFKKVGEMVKRHRSGHYIMSCFDIDNFKLINDQFGAEEGDKILRYVGEVVKYGINTVGGAAARIAADNFAAIYPADVQTVEYVTDMLEKKVVPKRAKANVLFSIGRYLIEDISLSPSAMYDRAYIAKQSIKGRYDRHLAYFTNSMLEELLNAQGIISDMDMALHQQQFEVWLQPQFNHANGALVGAEALVRWRHPQKGLIQPGSFISVFEQTGFIYELDKYVWEHTCRLLRRWLDAGLNPVHVSVNISRYDVVRSNLIEVITNLVSKYELPVELLRLEITESAFAEAAEQIIDVVKTLQGMGFTVEIDDFGSGYSSLNTLKDVPANGLKLDMRFLEDNGNSQRGGNILSSVVRMAKWLNMEVIAEGVETVEQADFLRSIGCNNIQGYLYSKPLPAQEYEHLLELSTKEVQPKVLTTVAHLDNNAFWNPQSMDTLIFNNYIGGACIFEYNKGNIELLRANQKYVEVIGSAGMTIQDALRLNWSRHLSLEQQEKVVVAIEKSIANDDEVTEEFIFTDLPGSVKNTFLRSSIRVIASAGERYLVYCTNENITAQRVAEEGERRSSERYRAIMSDINSGITAAVLRDGKSKLIFANEAYYRIMGYTREQFAAAVKSVLRPSSLWASLPIKHTILCCSNSSAFFLTCSPKAPVKLPALHCVSTSLCIHCNSKSG